MLMWIRSNLFVFASIIVGILFVVAVFSIRSCNDSRQNVKQAKQDTKAADAYAGAAKQAVEVVTSRSNAETDVDAIVSAATKEIGNAENPVAARAAVVAAVCGMQSYRYRPECKVQPVNP